MKSTIRLPLLVASAVIFSAAVLLVAAESRSVTSSELTVHEWGTFTSVAGEDGSALDWDALGCKDDLPTFVNNFGYHGFKWTLRGTVRMETPVIYFYSQQSIDAHVRVMFPHGLITEWYPRADYEVQQTDRASGSARKLAADLSGIDTSLKTLTGAIEWANVQVQPHTNNTLPVESSPSRYYAARETDASSITVDGQHEKFLFYRGVGRLPVPLSARVSGDGAVLVENRADAAVPMVIYFENRGGRLGYRNAGEVKGAVTPKTVVRPALGGSFQDLRNDLERALVLQGLFPKEASAMVETWKDSWFEEGARLIYIVPSRSIDAMLPLEIKPLPSQMTRVFVGRIELVTPETMHSVEHAISSGDRVTLDRYGRFLEAIVNRIALNNGNDPSQGQQLRRAIAGRRCGLGTV
jgi:hypothetical protein